MDVGPALARVLDALEPYRVGRSFRCTAHDDRDPSLSVAEGEGGRVLLHCFAGCEAADICAALGLSVGDLFPPKEDEAGPRYARPSGLLRLLELRYPCLAFLVAQSRADRAYYLDGAEREAFLRGRYPEVPDDVWEVLR